MKLRRRRRRRKQRWWEDDEEESTVVEKTQCVNSTCAVLAFYDRKSGGLISLMLLSPHRSSVYIIMIILTENVHFHWCRCRDVQRWRTTKHFFYTWMAVLSDYITNINILQIKNEKNKPIIYLLWQQCASVSFQFFFFFLLLNKLFLLLFGLVRCLLVFSMNFFFP